MKEKFSKDVKWLEKNGFQKIGVNYWVREFCESKSGVFELEVKLVENKWFEADVIAPGDEFTYRYLAQLDTAKEAVEEAIAENLELEQKISRQNEIISQLKFTD